MSSASVFIVYLYIVTYSILVAVSGDVAERIEVLSLDV